MTEQKTYSCIIDKNHNCDECTLKGLLWCERGNKKRVIRFYSRLGVFILSFLSSMILFGISEGIWWPTVSYIVCWIVYEIYNELILHCTHCPYFQEGCSRLTCMVNLNVYIPPWLKFNPRPYTVSEKVLLMLSNGFELVYPIVLSVYFIHHMYNSQSEHSFVLFIIFLALMTVGIIAFMVFFSVLRKEYCNVCAHFSCPLNTVSKEIVDQFLRKNPVIKDAWEKSGYRSGD